MKRSAIYLLSAITGLAGCKSIGPNAIRQSHPNFNQAIAQTLDEQLLINLVRMKYLETTLFLDVGTITDSRTASFYAGTDDTRFDFKNHTGFVNPTLRGSISQTPTVVYSPMQGQTFVRRLLAPVPLPILLNSIQSGWSPNRIFVIFVERINNLLNAPTASRHTPEDAPQFADFARMVRLMTELVKEDSLMLGIDPADRNRLVVRIQPNAEYSDIIEEFKNLLNLPQDSNVFHFQENLLGGNKGELRLRVRSVQSAMFYLANGIQVPQEHRDAEIVMTTRHANGRIFDWNQILGNIFTVHVAKERPKNAYVAVPYRNYWFYIDDSDLSTKTTFMLLANIFSLQAGDAHTVAPTLTIPAR